MPKAEKKISTFGQVVFIAFAFLVDATEAILDLFLIGIIANRIIDIIVAGIFFAYVFSKGLTIAEDWKVYSSIVGTIAGEFIPGLDIAPFFTIDAWYITSRIKAKDVANQKKKAGETKSVTEEQKRQEWLKNYEQQQQMRQATEAQEENEQEKMVA
jgi:hypothetical protein